MTHSSTIVFFDRYTHPYGTTYSNTHQSRDTMHLTFVRRHVKIALLDDKETHEFGDCQRIHLRTGMDTTGEGKEENRQTLSLRRSQKSDNQRENRLALHSRSRRLGSSERGKDTGNTQQDRSKIGVIPKNDFGPSRAGNLIDGP